mmetsp:Transcript_7610/g.8812  ORF Transcript_7610/g.8812 Transcript_7610/m.8812 type:complete len:99 (+) Transcript_7610:3074-3370(+)
MTTNNIIDNKPTPNHTKKGREFRNDRNGSLLGFRCHPLYNELNRTQYIFDEFVLFFSLFFFLFFMATREEIRDMYIPIHGRWYAVGVVIVVVAAVLLL